MKKRWGGTAALGVAVTALLGLSLTATSSAGASSGTTRGVTSTSITVGGLGFAEYYGDSAIGAEARFDAQNKAGGVDGRKIKFVGFKDDQSSPTVDIQQGKALVEQDQVFAVVPVVSITLAAGAYFAQQHVPVLRVGHLAPVHRQQVRLQLCRCRDQPELGDHRPRSGNRQSARQVAEGSDDGHHR